MERERERRNHGLYRLDTNFGLAGDQLTNVATSEAVNCSKLKAIGNPSENNAENGHRFSNKEQVDVGPELNRGTYAAGRAGPGQEPLMPNSSATFMPILFPRLQCIKKKN